MTYLADECKGNPVPTCIFNSLFALHALREKELSLVKMVTLMKSDRLIVSFLGIS